MPDPAPLPRSAFRRRWTLLINVLVGIWAVLFLIVLTHIDFTWLHFVPPRGLALSRMALAALMPFFIVNLVLQFRWSGLTFPRFVRRHWLDFLMILPVLRVLQFVRFFRVGRAALALRHLTRARKLFGFGRRARKQLRKILRARTAAGAGGAGGAAVAPAEAPE